MARSVYVAAEYKEDPLGFLIKLMDLTQYASELKRLSNGLYLLTGILTFRSLNHIDRMKVNKAILDLPRGYLLAKLAPMTAQMIANPYWFSWSLSDDELRSYYKLNNDFASSVEKLGLDFSSLTAVTLGGALLAASESGVKTAIVNAAKQGSNSNLAGAAAKKFGASGVTVQRAGVAAAIVTVFAGCMHALTSTGANNAKKELAMRGLLKLEDF